MSLRPDLRPDIGRRFAELSQRIERLERQRGGIPKNFRDLSDADLAKAADGQVPVYSSATGRWKPGSAGGGGLFVANGFDVDTTQPITGGTLTTVQYATPLVNANWATPGPNGAGSWTLDLGHYIFSGSIAFVGGQAGRRSIYLEHSVGLSSSRATWDRLHVTTTDPIYRSACVPIHVTRADNVVAVRAEQTGNPTLDVELRTDYTHLRIMRIG